MWLVRIALRRPYTFVVMSMLIVVMGVLSIVRMPTDIFPDIDIPVISVVFNYTGLTPEEMEKRIVLGYERVLTTTVNDIEHTESQSLTGIAVVKIFFQPGAHIDAATAQVTAISQVVLRQQPPGSTPPLVIRYSASNVPILQVALESDTLSEQNLFDYGTNFVRADFAVIPGVQVPYPYGGKQREIVIDVDPARLYGFGLSPRDVSNAITTQNVILPTGTTKMGTIEYTVQMNASTEAFQDIGDIPIKTVKGTTVYIRDIGNVRDGYSPQTNMVHVGGRRSVLQSILKSGNVSTLDIVANIRKALPATAARLPKELKISLLFDQSLFVRAAVTGVVKEAAIAAGLTAIMIFVFLGSWRSTLIVVISIPLSILVSIIILGAIGESLNVMTLGGLSLAVGILVDDATVEIENIHRNMAMKKPIVRAIMDGAREIATPAFVATLCICIVFVPVAFIVGAAKSLFIPLALAVVFAMMTSYFLSRTIVPTMVHFLLQGEAEEHMKEHHGPPKGAFNRFFAAFNRQFDRLRTFYGGFLALALRHRAIFAGCFLVFVVGSVGGLLPLVGRDFFPTVDAGLIKLHVRGEPGTRIEESERRFAEIENTIHTVIPADAIATMLDNIGTPYSGINLSLSEGVAISPADGDILISLKEDHEPTVGYVRRLRTVLREKYPTMTFFFLAPDISTQVLNFGLAAPIDIQVVGAPGNEVATAGVAQQIAARVSAVPGAADVHLAQVLAAPAVKIDVDRTMAGQVGLTERDIASDMLISLSSSTQVAPNYWLDTKRGVQYLVAVQTPQYELHSIDDLGSTPLSTGDTSQPQFLSNVATIHKMTAPANVTHFNASRTYDVQASIDGADLGSVSDQVSKIVAEMQPNFPRGYHGENQGAGREHDLVLPRTRLRAHLLGAARLPVDGRQLPVVAGPVRDPHGAPGSDRRYRVDALPVAHDTQRSGADGLDHVRWCRHCEQHSRRHVRQRSAGGRPRRDAGSARFRNDPAAAGDHDGAGDDHRYASMSLGLGEGGEQNAPHGRAVIGGLSVATFTTLFFVPVMYSILRRTPPKSEDPELESI